MDEANNSQAQMHKDEIAIQASLVQNLLNDQFPAFANQALRIVHSTGTVNAIFRLGDDLCVRLPRMAQWAEGIEREWSLLPQLQTHISLEIPEPIALGTPTDDFPHPWAIYRWIEGDTFETALVNSQQQAARDFASFIRELRAIDPNSAPSAGREPLSNLDDVTRNALETFLPDNDLATALAAWDDALETKPFLGGPICIHTDLLPSNILVLAGRIHAVLDFGGAGVGDPAQDITPAWAVFGPLGRAEFREELEVDEETWRRARGYALHQAALIIPYYQKTNAPFAEQANRTVEQVLLDFGKS